MSTLPVRVELRVGTAWVDITGDIYLRDLIAITRGQSAQGSTTDPARLALSIRNKAGRYSPKNPLSPYYGQFGRNSPIRVSLPSTDNRLHLPGGVADGASTPDATALHITGDLDLRLEAAGQWYTSGHTMLMSRWNRAAGQRSWQLTMGDGSLILNWSTTGTDSNGVQLNLPATMPRHAAVRVTLDVDNGSGGWTASLYWATSLAGSWTLANTTVTTGGTTSVFAGTANLRVGNVDNSLSTSPYIGDVYGAEVRNGIAGTLVANPVFSAQGAGTTTFTDGSGRAWTVGGWGEITTRMVRVVAEVAEWPSQWVASGADVWVTVAGAGILRRLRKGSTPLRSPVCRDMTAPNRTQIVAYWAMEDGAQATSLASAVPGAPALTIAGAISPAQYSDWAASDALPTMSTGILTGTVPPYTDTGTIYARMFLCASASGVPGVQRVLSITNRGTAALWTILVDTAGLLYLRAYSSIGTLLMDTGGVNFGVVNGTQLLLDLRLTNNTTGGVDWSLFAINIATSTLGSTNGLVFNSTLASATVGVASMVRVGEDAALADTAVGHLSLASSADAYANSNSAIVAWAGEAAVDRIARLCTEEQVPMLATAVPGASALLGPQGIDNLMSLLQAAADADMGILFEQREQLGLAYRSCSTAYNQAAALTLDYTQPGIAPPLLPTDDDANTLNDMTITRSGGSSARVQQTTGPMSILPPPAGVGPYDDSLTFNLFTDAQALDAAGWLVHLGTWDESRYPSIPVNMQRLNATQQAQAAALDTWDGLGITNLPSWEGVGTAAQLMLGYTESLGSTTWNMTFNCEPSGPYIVGLLDDLLFGRGDTDGSQLQSGITAAAATMSVAVTAGPLWVVDPAETPIDVMVGGEQMTVTTVGHNLSSNPFLTTDASGWSGSNATVARTTAFVPPVSRAVASLLVTPNGTSASGGVNGVLTGVGSVTAGATYVASCWVLSPGGWSDLRACMDWYDASGAFLSSALGVATVVSAGVATMLQQTLTAPASSSQAIPRFRFGGTPASSAIAYVSALRLVPTSTYTASPQQMDVTRAVNGISKAQTAGTDVRLYQAAIASY